MTLWQQYAFSWLSASTIYLIQYRKFNDNVLRGLQVVQSSSNSLNKWRFDSESIPWFWIGLIHAAHGSGKQCESIFNQTKHSVVYSPYCSIQREPGPHLTGHQKVTSCTCMYMS